MSIGVIRFYLRVGAVRASSTDAPASANNSQSVARLVALIKHQHPHSR